MNNSRIRENQLNTTITKVEVTNNRKKRKQATAGDTPVKNIDLQIRDTLR